MAGKSRRAASRQSQLKRKKIQKGPSGIPPTARRVAAHGAGEPVAVAAGDTRNRDKAPPAGLTGREAQVLRLGASGKTNHEVADELVLSIRTVERHIGNIYSKIGARGRADATVFALTQGFL